jgi:hypothetical protein
LQQLTVVGAALIIFLIKIEEMKRKLCLLQGFFCYCIIKEALHIYKKMKDSAIS